VTRASAAAEGVRTASGQGKATVCARTMNSYSGPPATLGGTAAAGARLIVGVGLATTRPSPIQRQWLSVTVPTSPFAICTSG
jgi:hypothetical protein